MNIIWLTVTLILSGIVALANDCKNGVCMPPVGGEEIYIVCAPVPQADIKNIPPTKPLDTFDGKTIALVGGSFMANITHPELKRLILTAHPSAKVYLLNEIGLAGPYPRPGVVRREKDEFQKRLREYGVDVVISGNGGCGLCTPKEVGSCIAAEAIGIPSVMITAPGFTAQARNTAKTHGVGYLRIAEYPGAFSSESRDLLIEKTRNVLWPQICQALKEENRKKELFSHSQRRENVLSGTERIAADVS